jgi:hypothetical protein
MSVAYLTLFYRFVKIKNQYETMFIDLVVLNQTIDELEESKIQSDESVHKENFIKFISDSRDWAFSYIEDVQLALNDFKTKVEPQIKYFEKYGEVGAETPDKEALRKISVSYKELMKVLPEDSQ